MLHLDFKDKSRNSKGSNKAQKISQSFEEKMLNFMSEKKKEYSTYMSRNFLNLQFFKLTQLCFRLIEMPP